MSNDENKIDVYIVAGDASVGKSEAIRYIVDKTIKQRGKYVALQTTTDVDVYAFYKTRSLQEAGIEVKDCIKKFNIKIKVDAIIIALRTDICNSLPIAEKYIDFYAESGYNIKFVAELLNAEQNPSDHTQLEEYCKRKGYKHKKYPYEKRNGNEKYRNMKQFFDFKGKKTIQPKLRI